MNVSRLKKRDLIDRFMLFLNVLVLLILLITYAAGMVSPLKFWPLAFVAMGYPVVLAWIVLFTAYWLFRRKWFMFLNIAFLLLRWDLVAATVQLRTSPPTTVSEGMKVMTYNVRLFDYYNWSKNKNTRHWIYDFLFNQQPNILCFQEFYHDYTGYFPTIDTLLEVNSLKHMHVENYTDKMNNKQLWGMATLSSYPIVNKGKIEFDGTYGNLCLFTDLQVNDDTIRVYNLHLQSIRLGREGYAVLDELVSKQELKDLVGGKNILKQMINGFRKRAQQAELVKAHMNACPYPVILCGDFNDVPTSYAYQTLAAGLEDSFSQSGRGIGNTFVQLPVFRIDNILFSREFVASQHMVHPYELSDHFAVSANLQFQN